MARDAFVGKTRRPAIGGRRLGNESEWAISLGDEHVQGGFARRAGWSRHGTWIKKKKAGARRTLLPDTKGRKSGKQFGRTPAWIYETRRRTAT